MKNSEIIIFQTLFSREVKRFLKLYHQTLIAPMITGFIFFSILVLALSDAGSIISNVHYNIFMGAGIIAMTMMQQSYANSSSSITISKINGVFIDYQIPPIKGIYFISAFTLAAMIRGLIIGLSMGLILKLIINFHIEHVLLLTFSSILCCSILGLIGIITGLLSNSFDQMSAYNTYFITPFSFLSGTFFSVKKLPEFLQQINMANPFFYLIDIFRYSITGYHESNVTFGITYLTFVVLILFFSAYLVFKNGYKTKA